ncbi:MAG TPA: tripartite tricarboxylate transporter substrate binding protein [Burkholderiales bacterium]|nr:tripartite tricarboxylate transporter substrate binding protein [Burkholderiales bacterium]
MNAFRVAAAAFAALLACGPAHAAEHSFPSKPVRILVGAPPGGSNDIFARAIGQRISPSLGQPVVVDNRPGANQLIAADLTAKAAPDGHTLYITTTSFAAGVAIQPKQPFDPVNDLTGVTMVGNGPMVLVVHPSLPAKTAKDLVAIARARPGQLNYTSSGIGSINHMAMEVLKSQAKIDLVHIPHKGMAPALTDLMAGNVQVLIVSLPSVTAQMKSGRLRALGVTSAKRTTFMPELPTVAESGVPGYETTLWWGIFAPAKTPKPIVDRLNGEIHKVMASAEMKKTFSDFGAEPSPTTPEAFTAMVRKEIAKWSRVVKEANIKPE